MFTQNGVHIGRNQDHVMFSETARPQGIPQWLPTPALALIINTTLNSLIGDFGKSTMLRSKGSWKRSLWSLSASDLRGPSFWRCEAEHTIFVTWLLTIVTSFDWAISAIGGGSLSFPSWWLNCSGIFYWSMMAFARQHSCRITRLHYWAISQRKPGRCVYVILLLDVLSKRLKMKHVF